MNKDTEIKELKDALKIALDKWQEADWHWTLEFGGASKLVLDHKPDDFELYDYLRSLTEAP